MCEDRMGRLSMSVDSESKYIHPQFNQGRH
jgi:hypothetical protein